VSGESLPAVRAGGRWNAILRHYPDEFAARCGLSLVDEGRVPTLFAEAWYDDGTVSWTGEEQPPIRFKLAHHQATG
jgi:hypothetical protein